MASTRGWRKKVTLTEAIKSLKPKALRKLDALVGHLEKRRETLATMKWEG